MTPFPIVVLVTPPDVVLVQSAIVVLVKPSDVVLVKTGIQIPAYAGMTKEDEGMTKEDEGMTRKMRE